MFAEVHVIGPLNDATAANQLRDNQLRVGLGVVALIAGLTGYMVAGIIGPERKCHRALRHCRASEATWATIARTNHEEIRRRDAVRAGKKRIRNFHRRYWRLH